MIPFLLPPNARISALPALPPDTDTTTEKNHSIIRPNPPPILILPLTNTEKNHSTQPPRPDLKGRSLKRIIKKISNGILTDLNQMLTA